MRSNEKFTQRAEYAIEKAGAAAGNMGHSYVGTEHLLLGILLEDSGVGARVLRRRGITESALRKAITSLDGTGAPSAPEHRLTLRAKQAFERAAAEAEALGQNYIGTEHLLLGILAPVKLRRGAHSGRAGNGYKRHIQRHHGRVRQPILPRPRADRNRARQPAPCRDKDTRPVQP